MNTYLKIAVISIIIIFVSGCASTGYIGNQYNRSVPGNGAEYVMRSSESLVNWASNNGQGLERKNASCNTSESRGRVNYSCNASNQGQSTKIDNQEVPPGALRRSSRYDSRGGYSNRYRNDYRSNRNSYDRQGGYNRGTNYRARAYIRQR